ncbi:MAG TPA: hypothetical protein VHX88_17025 [Solirubrobacteraceae bacterium]|jgi:hypothetical protein|nr:hypothetical protein [Solirubrobacteraceae bacterium]
MTAVRTLPRVVGLAVAVALALLVAAGPARASDVLQTISLGAGSQPTGVAAGTDTVYVAESKGDKVREITNPSQSAHGGFRSTTVAASDLTLDFPDAVSVLYGGSSVSGLDDPVVANFCVGASSGVCAGQPANSSVFGALYDPDLTGQSFSASGCLRATGVAADNSLGDDAYAVIACAGTGSSSEGVQACDSFSPPTCSAYALPTPTGGTTPVPAGVAELGISSDFVVDDEANGTVTELTNSASQANPPQITPGPAAALASGCQPAQIATLTDAAGDYTVFVACPGLGGVDVRTFIPSVSSAGSWGPASFDPVTHSTTATPFGVALSPTGRSLFVSDASNHALYVYALSGASDSQLGGEITEPTGSEPDQVAAIANGSAGTNVFVANENSGTVTALDPPVPAEGTPVAPLSTSAIAKLRAQRARHRRPAPLEALLR